MFQPFCYLFGWILKLVYLLWLQLTRLAAGNLMISRRQHYSQVCGFALAHSPWPEFLSTFAVYQSSLSPLHWGMGHTRVGQCGEWCGLGTWGVRGAHRSSGRRYFHDALQVACAQVSCWSPEQS